MDINKIMNEIQIQEKNDHQNIPNQNVITETEKDNEGYFQILERVEQTNKNQQM